MAHRPITNKNKQKLVQDFTAALMRMAQEVANNPNLHTKEWAKELGTTEWLRRGKILHQLEKDQKSIRDVLHKRNAELSNLKVKVAQLDHGYVDRPDHNKEKAKVLKLTQNIAYAERVIYDSQKFMDRLRTKKPRHAKHYAKNPAPIGLWTAVFTGLFGFNAYAKQMNEYQKIATKNTVEKEEYTIKLEKSEERIKHIEEQWKLEHKDQLEAARLEVAHMSEKISATRLQLDTYEREASAEQAQTRAHFKKIFEGKLSPAAEKEFSKHLEYVHTNKVAPSNPSGYTESFSDSLFMQQTIWLLLSDYETSYSAVSHTASNLSESSYASDFSSNMLSDYGMQTHTDNHSSSRHYSADYSTDYTSSHSHSHSSCSPASSCSSPSSCASSCGGGGGD